MASLASGHAWVPRQSMEKGHVAAPQAPSEGLVSHFRHVLAQQNLEAVRAGDPPLFNTPQELEDQAIMYAEVQTDYAANQGLSPRAPPLDREPSLEPLFSPQPSQRPPYRPQEYERYTPPAHHRHEMEGSDRKSAYDPAWDARPPMPDLEPDPYPRMPPMAQMRHPSPFPEPRHSMQSMDRPHIEPRRAEDEGGMLLCCLGAFGCCCLQPEDLQFRRGGGSVARPGRSGGRPFWERL